MKVWVAQYGTYDETYILGVFTSEEKAQASLDHQKGDDYHYSYWSEEFEIDEYFNKHLSKLSLVLK